MVRKKEHNTGGHDRGTTKSRTSLAAYARMRLPPHIVYDLYETILNDRQPRLEKLEDDEECPEPNCECRYRVVDMLTDSTGHAPRAPTLDQKLLVIARHMDRAYGQAAQHQVIEGEIKAEVQHIAAGQDPRYFQKLSPDALRAIRDALNGRATPALPDASEPEEIADAEIVEPEDR